MCKETIDRVLWWRVECSQRLLGKYPLGGGFWVRSDGSRNCSRERMFNRRTWARTSVREHLGLFRGWWPTCETRASWTRWGYSIRYCSCDRWNLLIQCLMDQIKDFLSWKNPWKSSSSTHIQRGWDSISPLMSDEHTSWKYKDISHGYVMNYLKKKRQSKTKWAL